MNQIGLMRPFDKDQAQEGEEICWSHLKRPVKYVGTMIDGEIAVDTGGMDKLEIAPASSLRMKPLFWLEEKPVYKGDKLWHTLARKWVVVTGLQSAREAAERGWFITENSSYDAALCRWEYPVPIPLAMINGKPVYPGTKMWHDLVGGVVTIQSKAFNGDLVDSNGIGRSPAYLHWKKDCVGYAGVYKINGLHSVGTVYSTREQADAYKSSNAIGLARLNWEEDLPT